MTARDLSAELETMKFRLATLEADAQGIEHAVDKLRHDVVNLRSAIIAEQAWLDSTQEKLKKEHP